MRKKGKQVGREKKWIVKVGNFFFFPQLLAELNLHCSTEQKPLSKILDPPLHIAIAALGPLKEDYTRALFTGPTSPNYIINKRSKYFKRTVTLIH